MADVTKDLVVRLAFEQGDTKAQIAAIKNELKLVDSAFSVAANSAGGFATSAERTAAKADSLRAKLSAQQQMVAKYGDALTQAKDKLSRFAANHDQYGAKLDAAKQKNSELKDKMKELARELEACAKSSGENSEEYARLASALEDMRGEVEASDREVKNLAKSFASSEKNMQAAANGVIRSETAYNNAVAAQRQMESELNTLNGRLRTHADDLEAAAAKLDKFSTAAGKVGEVTGKIGSTMMKASATIVAAGVAAAGAAVSWEDNFASVRKTVNGTDAELAQIEQRLLEMGTEIPVALGDLANIAANAGQLGVATENVISFTETMAMLAETTDMTADSASASFAQYANITGMSQEAFSNLGSAVVELGNNTATTESAIMSMATRIAAAGTQAGMTDAQIVGISAGLSSMGIQAEAGGSAFSKIMANIQTDVETGSEKLEDWARISGMTADQFAEAWKKDAAGAFIAFVKGLGTNTKSATVLLDELGLKELRLADTLKRSSGNWQLLDESISMASEAFEENNALSKEASLRNETTASKLVMLKNEVQETAMAFGEQLLPYVHQGVEFVQQLCERFSNLSKEQKDSVIKWGMIVAAIGPALKAFSGIANGTSAVTGAIAKIVKASAEGSTAVSALKVALSTLGSAALWTGVAAGVVYLTVKVADLISGADGLKRSLKELKETAEDWAGTNITTDFEQSSGLGAFGLSAEDFKPKKATEAFAEETTDWVQQVVKTWTDGANETDEILADAIKGFTDESEKARRNLQALNEDGGMPSIQEDIDQLDKMDARVSELLTKRQNGFLSADEKQELQDLYNRREAITVKYRLVEETGEGFDAIETGIRSHLSRGEDAQAVFADAYAAATQGLEAYNTQLQANYDEQFAILEAQRKAAEDAGNSADLDRIQQEKQALLEWYKTQMQYGETEFADLMATAASESGVFEEGGTYAETMRTITDAYTHMMQAAESGSMSDLTLFTDDLSKLDEKSVVEMTAAFTAMKQAGAEFTPEMESAYSALQSLGRIMEDGSFAEFNFGDEIQSDMEQLFGGNMTDELLEINATLGTDGLDESFTTWATMEHTPISAETEVAPVDATQISVNGAVQMAVEMSRVSAYSGTQYDIVYVDGTLKAVSSDTGATYATVFVDGMMKIVDTATAEVIDTVPVDGVVADVRSDGDQSYTIVRVDGELFAVDASTGRVTGKVDVDGQIGSITDESGNVVDTISFDGEVGTITVDPNVVSNLPAIRIRAQVGDVTVDPNTEVDFSNAKFTTKSDPGFAAKIANTKLTDTGYAGKLFGDGFAEDDSERVINLSNAIKAYNEACEAYNGAPSEAAKLMMNSALGQVDALREPFMNGFKDDVITSSVNFVTGTLQQLANGDEVQQETIQRCYDLADAISTISGSVMMVTSQDTIADAFAANGWDVDPSTLTATIDQFLSAANPIMEAHGAQEAQRLNAGFVNYLADAEPVEPNVNADAAEDVFAEAADQAAALVSMYDDLSGKTLSDDQIKDLKDQLAGIDDMDIDSISTHIANLYDIISDPSSSEDMVTFAKAQLQDYINMMGNADEFLGVGNNITAGIAKGMEDYGFDTVATTVEGDILASVKSALGIASPSRVMIPVGGFVAAGIAEGMSGYSFATAASSARNAISSAFGDMSGIGRNIGMNFGRGLQSGLQSSLSAALDTAQSYAQRIIGSVQSAWEVHSPSRKAEWLAEMFGRGIERGIETWPSVPEALLEAGTMGASKAMQTVSNVMDKRDFSANSNVVIDNLNVRGQGDIEEIARELATYTERLQRRYV